MFSVFRDESVPSRFAFLGLVAWVSTCLFIAGFFPIDANWSRPVSLAGLIGLVSAVGLNESHRAKTNARLAKLNETATTDSLTGVGNRRLLDLEIERRIAQLRRQGTTVSVLMIDVDHFKTLNDAHGHHAGDLVLGVLAKQIARTLRDMDLLTRYGGEEFAAVLPGTDLEHARLAAERIRAAVESTEIPWENQKLSATVSVGVSEANNFDTPESVLKRADSALYDAKRAGRNRCFYRECGKDSSEQILGAGASIL
ncbi:MAG: GGDEF domain-containing protein [Pirellula sp.]|jgi:diguanylate cyclase (GGDEF)-like protein